MARYKAYYSETDIENIKPKVDDKGQPIPIFEDDDQHILQYKIKEAGIEFKKVRIVDTFYEDKFNKTQEELKNKNAVYIQESVIEATKKYVNKELTPELKINIKNDIAKALSLNPILGVEISPGEIFIGQLGPRNFELNMPAYNINKIEFTL